MGGLPHRDRSSKQPGSSPGEIVGVSPLFQRSLTAARRSASCSAPVVIEGETGTGKELVARLIHQLSDRARRPFVPVNCGCIPPDLVENELFGHEAGAFTGASSACEGLTQQADGGTLFLDEIDTLVPRAQIALLRFLQQGEVRPVGGGRITRVDCRILAAANRPLPRLVSEGGFREDLFFRLSVLEISLPPLRERRGDIPTLARHFLRRFGNTYGKRGLSLAPETEAWIATQDWPGNVRELENAIHRAVLTTEINPIPLETFAPDLARSETREEHRPCVRDAAPHPRKADRLESFADAKAKAIAAWERGYLTKLMESSGGNVTAAAVRAGKERRALGKLLKKHGIATGGGKLPA